ncbi:unnamed protein product [Allacma fusca]|uniref:Uncharacterized protein n=1 Tax=Allacma fusca TaxID=39272 RepID=A0A8J2JHX2_9HEXA|nr:unnamed protein product [Allacma fusca]
MLVSYFIAVMVFIPEIQSLDFRDDVDTAKDKFHIHFQQALEYIHAIELSSPVDLTKFQQRQRLETDSDEEAPRKPPILKPLIIKSHPVLTSSPISSHPSITNNNLDKSPSSTPTIKPPPLDGTSPRIKGSSYDNNLKSQLEELFSKVTSFPHPTFHPATIIPSTEGFLNSFQHIKDAYFEVLEKLRDFRNNVTKRFEIMDVKIEEDTNALKKSIQEISLLNPSPVEGANGNKVEAMMIKMQEMERRYNISRLVDHCVYYILANNFEDAVLLWSQLEGITAPNVLETSENLRDIVKLAYARNSSNNSPIYPFLRRLQGVEKMPLYNVLINGMKLREDFDGTEIFYIAQFLKERNAVRSPIYSKIPRPVQYAVSGRNVNIVYFDPRFGRNYLHVRDDQDRKNRLNFYIQASQSYSDARAAVWNMVFEPSSDTFRIRNALYGDYMHVNEEGFLETLPANALGARSGSEFYFILQKETVIIHSKGYKNEPLVVIRGGGKYPFYFSLARENPQTPIATFLVEPDTLLR